MSFQTVTFNPTYKTKAVDYTGFEDITSTASAIGLALDKLNLLTPAGALYPFGGDIAPEGFFICNGSTVSRIRYERLFLVIGTKYGSGDGSTTFTLPDLRSRVIAGYNSGVSYYNSVGKTGGNNTHAITTSEMPAHTHSGTTDSSGTHSHTSNATGGQGNYGLAIADGTNTAINTDASGGELNVWTVPGALNINSNGSHTHTFTTGSTGDGNAMELLQPYITMNFIIKY